MSKPRDFVLYWPLSFDSHLRSVAAEVPVKFQSDYKSIDPDLTVLRLHQVCGKTSIRLVNRPCFARESAHQQREHGKQSVTQLPRETKLYNVGKKYLIQPNITLCECVYNVNKEA